MNIAIVTAAAAHIIHRFDIISHYSGVAYAEGKEQGEADIADCLADYIACLRADGGAVSPDLAMALACAQRSEAANSLRECEAFALADRLETNEAALPAGIATLAEWSVLGYAYDELYDPSPSGY